MTHRLGAISEVTLTFAGSASRSRIVAPRLYSFCLARARCSRRPAFNGVVAMAHSSISVQLVKMSQGIDLQCPRFDGDPSLQSQFLLDTALLFLSIGTAVCQNEELSLFGSRKQEGLDESDQPLVSRLSLLRNAAEKL